MRTIYPRQDLYSVQALVFRDASQAAKSGPRPSLLILTLSSDLTVFIGDSDISFDKVIATSTTFPLCFHLS